MLYNKYKYYVVINILFKLNMTAIIDTYFLVKVSNSLTYILRFLEIEALAGLLRVAPASMTTSLT